MSQSKIIETLKQKKLTFFSYARLKSDQLIEKNGLVYLTLLISYFKEMLEIVSRNTEKEKDTKNTNKYEHTEHKHKDVTYKHKDYVAVSYPIKSKEHRDIKPK